MWISTWSETGDLQREMAYVHFFAQGKLYSRDHWITRKRVFHCLLSEGYAMHQRGDAVAHLYLGLPSHWPDRNFDAVVDRRARFEVALRE